MRLGFTLWLTGLLIICGIQCIFSQSIIITGKVTDATTGEPIPYANIFIPGKFQGTITEIDGTYKFDVRQKTDSIASSSLGYAKMVKSLDQTGNQKINFELFPDRINLGEVVIRAGEAPEVTFFKNIVAAKPMNNPYNFETFAYESYNKYQIDLDDFTSSDLKKSRLLKGFEFLQDYIDTFSERGRSTLPIFLIEQLSDNYEQTDPKKVVEYVKGQKLTILRDHPLITDMVSNTNQRFNIYDNLVTIVGKNFVSPIADYGLSVYKYDINQFDTLYIDGEPHFILKFKPKRKGENTFTGEMAVNNKTFAVSSIDATVPDDASLGYISSFQFIQEYEKIELASNDTDTIIYRYAPSAEKIRMRVNAAIGKGLVLVVRKTKSFQDLRINQPIDQELFNPYKTTIVLDSAYLKSEQYWDTARHEKLSYTEAGIYEMVDSLKKTSKFKVIKYAASTITSGYAKVGPISIGHITSFFSKNDVEGWRFRFGMKTNRDFSQRVNLMGYVAYGLKDERLKYGGQVISILSKRPWHRLTFLARTDVDLMSRHAEEMDRDNIFTIASKPGVPQRLYNVDDFKILYDNEFYKDMTSYLQVQHRRLDPAFDFYYENEGVPIKKIITSEISYAIRWQHKSEKLPGTFDREAKANRFFAQFRKKRDYPVVWLRYVAGFPNVLGSNYRFQDLALGLQGDVSITAKQSMYYNFWAGQIFGRLPFLLLKNPEGNFSYVHNKYFFNNMNLLEFSADRYVSLNYQYFLGGWIGDRIPLIKKLKLRAVATTNIFWGDMTDENRDANKNNKVGIASSIPYVEAGFGIENILRFLRLDFIWRATHRDSPGISNFGNKFCLYASFFIKV